MTDQTGRVVAGFDGSPNSHDALRLARLLAQALDEPLEVAIALAYEPLPLPVDAYDDAFEQHFDQLFVEAGRNIGADAFVRRELRERSPARALTELAEAEPVEIIAVGSAENCEEGRAEPSRVGERLLTGAPAAVAIAPRGYGRGDADALDAIGVAYDGTPEAKRALAMGERLARRSGAALRVIAVVPEVALLPSRTGHTRTGYVRFLREQFEEVLAAAREELAGDVDVELVLREGPPAATLAELSRDLDLIVVGSRGYGPIRRALLGGTASDLLRSAPCPVLVTPRP